jgi:subtilase family serine protease
MEKWQSSHGSFPIPGRIILSTSQLRSRRLRRGGLGVIAAGAAIGVIAALPAAPVVAAASRAAHLASVRPVPAVGTVIDATAAIPSPLPTSQCVVVFGIHCYTPVQYRNAYDLNPLYAHGITGAGKTIVVVDSFGSPTIRNDLHVFDQQFGFPDPALQIDQAGVIPPFDPHNPTMVGWAVETTGDVEYAHSVAPGAKIVLVETPVAETEGVTGFPEMMNAEKALIDQGVGDVITQSFGATENTFPGFGQGDFSSLLNLRYAFKDAFLHGVTVLASSGDFGATNSELDGSTLYPMQVNSWPSADPLVTSVGGTQLNLDDQGNRLTPDVAWNDGFGAGGGGPSHVFTRPLFQTGVRAVVGTQRGTPDISMSAAVDGAAWFYQSFSARGASWGLVAGTSEASPIFSGIVALAAQLAGHRLGDINPALYTLGALSQFTQLGTGLVDVTTGNNSFAGVTGFAAAPGYDMASGWGTVDANAFVRALARF